MPEVPYPITGTSIEDIQKQTWDLVRMLYEEHISGFSAAESGLWGGNADLSDSETTIVLGNLDGVSKIALGASADSLTVAGAAAGFIADGTGKLYCGDGEDEYLKYDTTDGLQISTASSDGITLKSGGGIAIEAGGDITLEGESGDTEADRSIINFVCDNFTAKIAGDFNDDVLAFYPDTAGEMGFRVGYRPWEGATSHAFNDIKLISEAFTHIGSTDGTQHSQINMYSSLPIFGFPITQLVAHDQRGGELIAGIDIAANQPGGSANVIFYTGTTGLTNRGSFDKDGKFWLKYGPLEIDVASGDPIIIFDTDGADRFTIGVDDDDGDKFKISGGGSLGSNDWFIIDSSGNTTLVGNLAIPSSGTIGPAGDTDLITLVPSQATIAGTLVTTLGFRTTSSQYSPGVWVQKYGDDTPEHSGGTGFYDHTGGAAENLFTKTAGAFDFEAEDATNGNWILLLGAKAGAVCEIKEVLSTTTCIVDGLGWDEDIGSQAFNIYKHPTFVTGDGHKTEFCTGATGEFEVHSYSGDGTMAHFKHRVNADDSTAVKIDLIGNGKNDLDGIRLAYETGDIQPLDDNECIHITIDESAASSADATTEIHALKFEKTNVNTLHSDAIHVGPGFTDALHVVGTPSADPDYGYEVTSGSVADRGDSGDDSFITAGTDVQIFDNVNDYILIGDAAKFEIIEVVLATGGSKDSSLEFYYSTTGSGFASWTQFYPTDTTNGFQNSGTITFPKPALWDLDDEAEANGDITNAYYIGIKRTKLGAYTYPTESFFKIYVDQEGGMSIRGDGVVQLPYLGAIPANPVNGMIWMEADGLHLYYGGAEKVVAGA